MMIVTVRGTLRVAASLIEIVWLGYFYAISTCFCSFGYCTLSLPILGLFLPIEGPIPGEEILKQGLGTFISAREHLLKREEKKTPPPSSLRSVSVGMERHDLSPINLKGLHALRLCPEALETNLSLDSIDAAVQELKAGKEVNNWVIVDCTPSQLGRNPSGLVDISVRTGIHVVSTWPNVLLFLWGTMFIEGTTNLFFCL